jgi:hypothetical protein
MAKQAEMFDWLVGIKQGQIVLRGIVVNHPTLPDFTEVSATSPVLRIEFVLNRYVVHTQSGSSYKLGVPNSVWSNANPSLKQAFIERFLENAK